MAKITVNNNNNCNNNADKDYRHFSRQLPLLLILLLPQRSLARPLVQRVLQINAKKWETNLLPISLSKRISLSLLSLPTGWSVGRSIGQSIGICLCCRLISTHDCVAKNREERDILAFPRNRGLELEDFLLPARYGNRTFYQPELSRH